VQEIEADAREVLGSIVKKRRSNEGSSQDPIVVDNEAAERNQSSQPSEEEHDNAGKAADNICKTLWSLKGNASVEVVQARVESGFFHQALSLLVETQMVEKENATLRVYYLTPSTLKQNTPRRRRKLKTPLTR